MRYASPGSRPAHRVRVYPPPMLVACTVSVECRTGSRLAKGRGVIVVERERVMSTLGGEHFHRAGSGPGTPAPRPATVSRAREGGFKK